MISADARYLDPIAIDRALVARGGLYEFMRLAWDQVEVSPFVGNWHLEEMCTHLEAVSNHEIKNLVINVPPGTGKSLTTNVFWPCWEWIDRPETKWIYGSFDPTLMGRDALRSINLLRSTWFVRRWGHRLPPGGKLATANHVTLAGGFRFSTSPGGKATGRHGDIFVTDDPIKPKDALGGATMTKNALRAVSEWLSATMSTRRADAATFRKVIIMQRLHEEDPAGEAIASGDYTVLRLPMRFEADDPSRTAWGGDRRTTEGELLFPARFPESAVATLEKDLHQNAAAQLQQRPIRQGGGIFKRPWWRFYHKRLGVPEYCFPGSEPTGRLCVVLPDVGYDVQSWDMAFKGNDDSDFVCGGMWRSYGEHYYLVDQLCERLDFPASVTAMRSFSDKHPSAYDKLVEDKANGPAIESTLRGEMPGITLVTPMGGKEARANAGAVLIRDARVFVPHPEIATFDVLAYLAQHERFPRGKNDDMVDQTSQALVRFRQHGDDFARAMRTIRGEK
jgi:predicted phage terminase large subunit-like protein